MKKNHEYHFSSEENIWNLDLPDKSFLELPGSEKEPEKLSKELADYIYINLTEIKKIAIEFLVSLCKDQDGWEMNRIEIIKNDTWDADYCLVYFIQDYVVFYVGFKEHKPLYVLQRIE